MRGADGTKTISHYLHATQYTHALCRRRLTGSSSSQHTWRTPWWKLWSFAVEGSRGRRWKLWLFAAFMNENALSGPSSPVIIPR